MIIRAIGYEGASFTQIKNITRLSTGTIYHHLYTMRELVYKENKRYKLTKLGLKVLKEIESGTLEFNKISKRDLRIRRLMDIFLLLKIYRLLLRSLAIYPVAILLLIIDSYISLRYNVGLILLKPTLFPHIHPLATMLLSILIIIILNLSMVIISTGTYYSRNELLNICLIQFVPISITYIIPLIYIFLNLNIAVLNTIIQFIAAILLASAVSTSSGLTIDRTLALSAFLLFLSQVI